MIRWQIWWVLVLFIHMVFHMGNEFFYQLLIIFINFLLEGGFEVVNIFGGSAS